jgi:orotidine-5'-phosphate decarboxylase
MDNDLTPTKGKSMDYNPIICAIDHADVATAKHLIHLIQDHIGAVKLGLEFFTRNGPKGVQEISATQLPVFLDLKFHDIPNTVAESVKAAVNLDIFMLTIHTQGGPAMMKAAVEAAKHQAEMMEKMPPLVMGVTILTSLGAEGDEQAITDQVLRLSELAKSCGLDGIVCSPLEIAAVRHKLGDDFKLVVPGIRSHADDKHDQKRTLSAAEAIALGADFLVIGRPITKATDPKIAAMNIESMI